MNTRDYDVIYKITNALNRDDGIKFTCLNRLNVISDFMKDSKSYICLNPDGNLSRIYASNNFFDSENPVVISSHVDCKQKSYDEQGIYYPFCRKTHNDKYLQGTFDNAITNAAILLEMIDGNLDSGVAIAFTGDEEVSAKGTFEVTRLIKENCKVANIVTYITLDVTYDDAWKRANFTIENNYIYQEAINKILAQSCIDMDVYWGYLPRETGVYPPTIPIFARLDGQSMPDESEAYSIAGNANVFSLCIPTNDSYNNYMHTDYGIKIRVEDFDIYRKAVSYIANKFSIPYFN